MEWKIVKHKDLSINEGLQIAYLKDQHWQYGVESQIRWMKDNLFDDDKHLMGTVHDGNQQLLKAYTTLTSINVDFDGEVFECIGIGNVCVDKDSHHLGVGRLLMMESERYIKNQHKCGILLCKDPLIPFYEKCGWKLIRYRNAFVAGNRYDHNIMTFGRNCTYMNIKMDKNF